MAIWASFGLEQFEFELTEYVHGTTGITVYGMIGAQTHFSALRRGYRPRAFPRKETSTVTQRTVSSHAAFCTGTLCLRVMTIFDASAAFQIPI